MPIQLSDFPEQTRQINNDTYHYVQTGNDAPDVLLIHGSLCDYRYWRWQLPAFASAAGTLAPSLRGYWPGIGSHPSTAFSVQQHARDMLALIETLAPDGALARRPGCDGAGRACSATHTIFDIG